MLMYVESMYGVCMLIVAGCNAVAIEHGRYSLSCMQKQCGAVLGMYGMLGALSNVVKFYCC